MAEPENTFQETRMTLGEHLEELRKRLFRSVLAIAIVFGFAWWFKEDLAQRVMWPWRDAVARINQELVVRFEDELKAHPEIPRSTYFRTEDVSSKDLRDPIDARLTAFSIGDSFFFSLNISLYFSAIIAGPFVLWQLWQFIAAGLYPHERRMVHVYFPFSLMLFLAGVAFCYLWVVPTGMYFLAITLPTEQVHTVMGLEKYFDFLSTLCLAMGAMFQLPIIMIFLSSMGLIEPQTYSKYRGHFLVIALIIAAIVTPGPDWISQVLMTIPMYVLYEVGILIAYWRARPRRKPKSDGTIS